MDIMLGSFGIAQEAYRRSKGLPTNLGEKSFFFSAPPFLKESHRLIVDVTPLILYEKVIINNDWLHQSYKWHHRTNFVIPIFDTENVAELLRKGIIEPRDYSSDTARQIDLVESITTNDLSNLSLWREVLSKSNAIWQGYTARLMQSKLWLNDLHLPPLRGENVFSGYSLNDYLSKDELDQLLEEYLLTINNNLLLSRSYSAGLFDWFDYEPFYTTKLGLGETAANLANSTISQGASILSFYLPLEQITSANELLKVRDKAKGLREYIEAKWRGDPGADEKTLLKILLEIDQAQRRTAYYQKIASYFTLPLGLVPLAGPLLEKVTDQLIAWGIEKASLHPYRWHFSLLDYMGLRLKKPEFVDQRGQVVLPDLKNNQEVLPRCEGVTKEGARCRRPARSGSKYCSKAHEPCPIPGIMNKRTREKAERYWTHGEPPQAVPARIQVESCS